MSVLQFVTQHLACFQVTPTCSQRCSGHTDTQTADAIAQFAGFPLSPGLSCEATRLMLLISFVCAPWDSLSAQASLCLKLFFFPPPFFSALTHNVCSNLSAPAMAAGVSILSDLSYSMSGARSGVVSREMETGRRDDLICIVLISLHYINYTNKQQRTVRWKLFDEQDIFSWISC